MIIRRTPIKEDSSSIVKALIERSCALHDLIHTPTKGQLRQLLVSNLLRPFMTSQFDIGSGIIVNQRGDQSKETDVIIYDNRIVPPFMKEAGGTLGAYPAESVIATIEVKSRLGTKEVLEAERSAKQLHEVVYHCDASIYHDLQFFRPLCALIGFYGDGETVLCERESGESWLGKENIMYLTAVCLIRKFSWICVKGAWAFEPGNDETNEETKRFVAVLLDNVRTKSEERYKLLLPEQHRDWLGIYIRDQEGLFQWFGESE
jgi:hypothetical protein